MLDILVYFGYNAIFVMQAEALRENQASQNETNAENPRIVKNMPLLKELIAATYTPFDANGELRLDRIPDYVDYLLDIGMSGLYVCGSTGEGISMSVEERFLAAEAFVRAADNRVPVVVQVGANGLVDCCKLAAHAAAIGASAISANAPSYFKIGSAEMLADWTAKIAEAAPRTPFYYYHIPSLTGISVDIIRYLELVGNRIERFGGIKYTDIRTNEYQDAILYGHGKYEILWGCDEIYLSALAVGARGGVGSTYAFLPNVFRGIITSWEKKEIETAGLWQNRCWQYVKVLNRCGSFHAAQKMLLRKLGFDFGLCRLPIPKISEDAFRQIERELESIGYFDWERSHP